MFKKIYIKQVIIFLTVFAIIVVSNAQSQLHIRHINVIDVKNGKVVKDQVVNIVRNKIISIKKDNNNTPVGSEQVDGSGKFLIPGLWDMHWHSGSPAHQKSVLFPLALANGLTGIRSMRGTREELQIRDSVAKGFIKGPRMVVGTPFIDAANSVFPNGVVKIGDAEKVQTVIDSLHAIGYDFMKFYEFLENDVFLAMAAYCRTKGIPFAGHTPIGLPLTAASKAGLQSIEHSTGVSKAFSLIEDSLNSELMQEARNMKTMDHFVETFFHNEHYTYPFDRKKAASVVKVLKQNSTAIVPTLSIYKSYLYPVDSMKNLPGLVYYSKPQRNSWYEYIKSLKPDTNFLNHQLANLRFLHQNGVMILAGTDAFNPYVLHGFSLHDELEWYSKAGMSNLAVLQTATLNPAKFLKREKELGTVAKGKLADLIILNANPLENISNTRAINAVIVNGKLLSRTDLDEMLLNIRKRYE